MHRFSAFFAVFLVVSAFGASHEVVPRAYAQGPTPPTLLLQANQPAFGPGATLSVTLGLRNTGAPVAADLYFGAILADGDSVIFFEGLGLATGQGRLSNLATIRPMLPGLAIATNTDIVVPDFFRYTWQGNELHGTYQLFFAATTPGALRDGQVQGGELLAMETQSILNLPPATITTDPARAGSAVVGRAGGNVTTAAADGTVYTLVIPEGALAADTAITLTPVTQLSGLPVAVPLAAGVHGAPTGLRFTRPATLIVDLPQPLQGDVFGMPMPDSGAGFDLEPVARSGARLQMRVEHFSVLAIPRSVAGLMALVAPTSSYARAIQLSVEAGRTETLADVQALLDYLARWYDTELLADFGWGLYPGATDDDRLTALAEFKRWEDRRVVMEMLFADLYPTVRGVLTARATQGRLLAFMVLAGGYHGWNNECRSSSGAVSERLNLADRAAGFVILSRLYLDEMERMQTDPSVSQAAAPNLASLDLANAQVLASLCALEVVAEVNEPAVPPGGTGQLRVRAGTTLNAGPTAFGSFMRVAFQANPASTSSTRATTNATGEAFFPVTADANGNIVYRVCAFFRDDLFPSGLAIVRLILDGPEACRSAVTGVVVSPSQVTIARNASQQFTAVVEGTPNQQVTWAVDGGGTITQTGLFTSNGTSGTFFVSATSHEDPSSVGIAQVTVEAHACAGESPCVYTGTWTFCQGQACDTFPSGTFYSHPTVRVGGGTPLRGTVSWNAGHGCDITAPFTLEASGGFSGGERSTGCGAMRSIEGTLSAQSLVFTMVEFHQGHVITFTGSRVP